MPIANDLAVHWLKRHVTGNSLLDVGCRNADHSKIFAEMGHKVTAIDVDPTCIPAQHCLMLQSNAKWEVHIADALRLPFLDGEFDCVMAVFAIQHTFSETGDEDIVAYKECARVLKPGGHLLLVQSHADVTRFDYDRLDPQRINSTEDVLRRIILPTGLIPVAIDSFHYSYEANTGDFATLEQSNAICLDLVKP